MLRKVVIAFTFVAIAVILLAFPTVHVVRGDGGGTLYWNTDRALVFMTEVSEGARLSYLRYAVDPLFMALGRVHPRGNLSCSRTFIIQITAKDVQTFNTELPQNNQPDCFGFQLFNQDFYAAYWPKLWKWAGDATFQRPTPEQYGAYATAFLAGTLPPGRSSKSPWQFDDVNGWSMRSFDYSGPRFDLRLAGQPITLIFHGRTYPERPLFLEVVRPGQAAQTIWTFDEQPHRVSKAEYEKIFPTN